MKKAYRLEIKMDNRIYLSGGERLQQIYAVLGVIFAAGSAVFLMSLEPEPNIWIVGLSSVFAGYGVFSVIRKL